MGLPGNAIDIVHVSVERETQTMADMAAMLERLDQPAIRRVMRWLADRYCVLELEDL